jgi:tetratricopeptide (TPR) repeat protein
LRPDAWLDAPSRPLDGVPARKLLLLLDNLNAHCYRARREVSPRADSLAMPLHEPFQKRLLRTLEALETFYGRGEIRVLATARNERVPEREGEPAEWDKLEWERYPDLWGRFALYEVPEPDREVAARLLETLGEAAGVCVEGAGTIARRNDGTLRNLVENLDMAANPERGLPALTPETFRDTLRGTWAERYRRALARYPEAKYLYWAAALLRRYGFPLERRTALPLARDLLPEWNPWVRWVRLPRALRDLERREALYTPRDGQLEAAGPPEVDETAVVRFLIRLGEQHRLADALYNLARKLMQPEGAPSAIHHPDAARILQKVTAWQPENPAAWYHLGVAYALAGQHEQAIHRALGLSKRPSPWTPNSPPPGTAWATSTAPWAAMMRPSRPASRLSPWTPKTPPPGTTWATSTETWAAMRKPSRPTKRPSPWTPNSPSPGTAWATSTRCAGSGNRRWEAFRRAQLNWIAGPQTGRHARAPPGVYHASVASALRALGREAEAQEEIARARPLMEKETEYNRARFAAICGEREEALRLLEIALQKRQALPEMGPPGPGPALPARRPAV